MRNFHFNVFLIILFALIGVFAGYENPNLVEVPKKNIKYFLKKIGLIDSFFVDINKKTPEKKIIKKTEDFFGNSFSLEITKIKSLEGKTAGIFFNENDEYKIFTQKGEVLSIDKKKEINLPLNFTTKNEGGVRSVIFYNNKYYALLSRKKKSDCNYSSLIEVTSQDEIFNTKCIPDKEKVNFAGLGGAYTYLNGDLLLSVGTPTHHSDIIDLLAQSNAYHYGKILLIKKQNIEEKNNNIKHFSLGHRNPQGLVNINDILFSTEHGPQGGDELNKIKKGKNYGWPVSSLGTRYGGNSYDKNLKKDNFEKPLFSFLPAIAPSMLSNCPKNLQIYYKDFKCLMGLTLKEMSLIIYLLDKESDELITFEKILLDKRMRHFALSKSAKLYSDKNDNFYFSSDKDGVYKAKFKEFR